MPVGLADAADAINDQWRAFMVALATVPGPTWVSEPARIRLAEDKALQLRCAAEVGLLVPEALWTNDVHVAREFLARHGDRAAVKSVTTAWWEGPAQTRFVFASLVEVGDLPSPERLASAPVCFQQPIWPKRDIRVTVAGEAVFAAIREADALLGDEPLDWRSGEQREWAPYELPADIAERCRSLVTRFGLRFSGIDLVLDEHGQHWFVELNPNGEWGWLERAGLPIAEALAHVLLSQGA